MYHRSAQEFQFFSPPALTKQPAVPYKLFGFRLGGKQDSLTRYKQLNRKYYPVSAALYPLSAIQKQADHCFNIIPNILGHFVVKMVNF